MLKRLLLDHMRRFRKGAMDKFALSIKALEHGWAELTLMLSNCDKVYSFENVPNDPLYDLLESAMKINCKIDSTISFHNCSQIECLGIKNIENNLCCIEADGIHTVLSKKRFSKAVLRMFDSYIFDFSCDEYCNRWNAFPSKELEKLRELYCSLVI